MFYRFAYVVLQDRANQGHQFDKNSAIRLGSKRSRDDEGPLLFSSRALQAGSQEQLVYGVTACVRQIACIRERIACSQGFRSQNSSAERAYLGPGGERARTRAMAAFGPGH